MKSVNIENKLLLVNLSNIHDSLDEENQLSVKDARKLAATLFSTGAAGVIFWDSNARYYKDFFNFKECDTLPGPVIFVSYAVGKRLSAAKQETYAELLISKPVVVTKKCHNIIGYIDNHAPCTIVVGAHYDHLGISRKNEIRYGSDDNASGTVTLMELSRFLKNSGNKQNNYLFIAFSGEEEGLVGSGYFCVNPTIDLKTINFMFNFDMVGRLGCEGNRVTAISTGSSPEWKRIFSETPHPGFRIKKMKGGAAFSDHYGFYKKGIPVAYLTTGMHYDYHTPKDTPDKINYDGMVSITKYAEDFIRQSEEQGRIEYSKVPGWYNFTCTTSFIWSELDYIFHEGFDGME
jgi:Zn-dependent M28 family amino/carboxypeptidase